MATTTTLLQHDPAAPPSAGFAAVHPRVAPHLLCWAAARVGPALRQWLPIDDFVQEVWARAFTARATFDPQRGSFRSWLLGIAHNVLREQLRTLHCHKQRRPLPLRPPLDAGAIEPSDPATSVVGGVLRDERHALVLRAVDALPPEARDLLLWRGLEQLPFEIVGQRLGIGADAAESRWRRLLPRLHASLPPDLLD